MAECWEKECKDLGFEVSVDRHLQDLQKLIDSNDSDLIVLGDPPVGYLGIIRFINPLGTEMFANEHYWYIVPDKRGIGAIRLMKAAQEWAVNKGCKYLLMTASKLASDMHDKVCRIYEKTGFEHFETTYIKRVV